MNLFSNSSQTNYNDSLLDQILGMARRHHHYHHRVCHASQPLDLQLGLGLGPINLGYKRVSEIRSASTLLAPNRLLVQTVVDLDDPVHPHPTNHFPFHHQPPSTYDSFAWGPNLTQIPIFKNEQHSVDASPPVRAAGGWGGAGSRPIILGLGSDEESQKGVDDGRLHSLETGVTGLYECPTCRIEFYSRFCYAAHVKIHHEKETRQERRMRLHNKYMSKMARRRRRLLRTWTAPTATNDGAAGHTSASPSISVKIENETE